MSQGNIDGANELFQVCHCSYSADAVHGLLLYVVVIEQIPSCGLEGENVAFSLTIGIGVCRGQLMYHLQWQMSLSR
jgi:hypothetical protein